MARLFHTLVVYGAAAALSGCGARDDDPGEALLGEGGGAGDGGSSGFGDGGTGGVATGGASGAPDDTAFGGGSAGTGDGGTVASRALSTYAQWSCEDLSCGGDAFLLDGLCPEDPSRPSRPSDCAPDEWFQCLRAKLGDAIILVNCSCEPMATLDGCVECATDLGWTQADCNGPVSVCTCFTAILLR